MASDAWLLSAALESGRAPMVRFHVDRP